jgi:hypothetical protein
MRSPALAQADEGRADMAIRYMPMVLIVSSGALASIGLLK